MPVQSSLSVRTLMSPDDDVTSAFLAFVASAKESIFINIYGYHMPALSDTLIAKHQAGVEVSIILDHTQEAGKAEHSEVEKLVAAGVPILIGTSPKHRAILHLKATTVDRKRVAHGSWNYSLSASDQLNDIHFVEDAAFAAFYLRHHDRIRSFILLDEMAMQLPGEVLAPAAFDATHPDPDPDPESEIDAAPGDPVATAAVSPTAAANPTQPDTRAARVARRSAKGDNA